MSDYDKVSTLAMRSKHRFYPYVIFVAPHKETGMVLYGLQSEDNIKLNGELHFFSLIYDEDYHDYILDSLQEQCDELDAD